MGIEYYIVERDTYSMVRSKTAEGKKLWSMLSIALRNPLCMRRGN